LTLAKRQPNELFVIAGEGSLRESLEKDAPNNVIFINWSTPELVWGASDIALLTSDNEAQPLSLIEASQAGLPILSMDVGSVKEVVVNNRTGFLSKTETELEDYLKILSENKEIREKFGIEAKKVAIANFSIDQFLTIHINLYEKD
jgi:glycosyltransferase involved in cell wall biosynthesis